MLAGVTTLAVLAAGVVPVALAPTASADPAPGAPSGVFGVGPLAGTVPDGTCSVEVVAVGGAGGRSAAGANGLGANGGGARVTATFDVVAGTPYTGSVGGGGRQNTGNAGGVGGANGGGAGGAVGGQHGGAGGGGYSELVLGGELAVLAGGGGGSGGGHSVSVDGFGGDAGLPTAAGETAGGSVGTDGYEGQAADGTRIVVGGGSGGGTTAPGAGGVHGTDASLNGLPGTDRAGGAGAYDPNYDAGGGGGGGYTGGGGGASTIIQNSQSDGTGTRIETVAGGGGGGGSSYVAAGATGVSASAVGRQTGTGSGADGSISLTWVPCAYDLAVTKTVSVDGGPAAATASAQPGDTLTWTVTVTNQGPAAMTRGDVVTLRDVLPGSGAATLTSVATSGGANDAFERGAVVCGTAAGQPAPAELECARPFALLGQDATGSRGLDVGEVLTVVYTQTAAGAPGATLTNVASVEDRGASDDNTATATVDLIAPPTAADDSDTGNTIGDVVVVDVLGNDSGVSADLDPSSVVLRDPSGAWVTSLVVPGEGTWTVDPVTGAVAFAPEAGFLVDPAPVAYRVTDANGLTATAAVVVEYLPAAADDTDAGHAIGEVVVVDVLANDTGDLVPGSVRLVDPAGGRVDRLVVPGEGTWTVDPATGRVTFAPEAGFLVDPRPVPYEVTDTTGDTVAAVVTVGYVPDAVDDVDRGNTLGEAVRVAVLSNDAGDLDPGSVRLAGPDGALVTELVVPGEGTWSVDPQDGAVTFTPEAGFVGDPTPVGYRVTDSTGDTVGATVSITYLPVALDDLSAGHTLGDPVTVDVVGNDTGDLDPASVRLIDPAGRRVTRLPVEGEGVWSVDTTTGRITFTPGDGYNGNPTPVEYEVATSSGEVASAQVVVTYLPQAADDADEGNPRGTAVTVDVLGNDRGTLDPATVRLVDPAGGALVTRLVVTGEGTWTVDPVTGAITFSPAAGFLADPTPVGYQVSDVLGNVTAAQVRITYVDAPAEPAPPVADPPAADPAPSSPLAVTGSETVAGAAGALLLLLAGAALVGWRRRAARG